MGSFYQTEVMEKFIAEEKESEDLGGDLDGVIIWGHKPMLFLHRLSLNTPPPSYKSTSWTRLPLRTVGH